MRSKGLCPACRSRELPQKERKPLAAKRKPKDDSLAVFFGAHVARLSAVRRSLTGAYIEIPGVCNVCHLYPKRRYKSVAKDDRNVIYLTMEEHTRFDNLLDSMDFNGLLREFGNTWLWIANRMVEIAPDIKEEGKLKTELLKWMKERNSCS